MKPYQVKAIATKVATALALFLASTIPAGAQFPGGGGRGTGATSPTSGGLQAATRVSVVADEYSNSLIILAPEPYHEAISNLVRQLDVPVQDITELRAFQLRNADPTEMAKVLTSLFPDPTTSTPSARNGANAAPSRRCCAGPRWLCTETCKTGISASGYASSSGTHAP